MAVVVVCLVMLGAGLVAGIAWGGQPYRALDHIDLSAGEAARRIVWHVAMALVAGAVAGMALLDAGGRLAMRMLAVTAGDAAQGMTTEAEEIVGEVTVDGTIGFVLFNGIVGGVFGSALYLLLRRALPPGRLGGLMYGAGLLAVFGATVDPLRRDNRDFDIVGPGWLSVVLFAAVVVGFGVAVAALVARLSTWLPLPSTDRRVLLRYVAPAAIAAFAFSVTAVLAVVATAAVLVSRWQPAVAAVRSTRFALVLRAVGAIAVVLSVPNLAVSVVDIIRR